MKKILLITLKITIAVVLAYTAVLFVIGLKGVRLERKISCHSIDGETITVSIDCTKHRCLFNQEYYKGVIDIDGIEYVSEFNLFAGNVLKKSDSTQTVFLNMNYANSADKYGHQVRLIIYSADIVWIEVLESGNPQFLKDGEYYSKGFFGPAEGAGDAERIWERISNTYE